jgi:hypothetical protein
MIPERRDDVICRKEEFGAIIFDPEGGKMHKVNKTGYYIWELCNGKDDVDTITRTLAEQEGEPFESVKPAVEAFLNDMNERQLIRWQ